MQSTTPPWSLILATETYHPGQMETASGEEHEIAQFHNCTMTKKGKGTHWLSVSNYWVLLTGTTHEDLQVISYENLWLERGKK